MLALQPQIITLEEYEALPEDKRVEVFDGVVYDMAIPSQEHQTILSELHFVIKDYLKKKKGKCQILSK
jgi:Uma2 family endonuclease